MALSHCSWQHCTARSFMQALSGEELTLTNDGTTYLGQQLNAIWLNFWPHSTAVPQLLHGYDVFMIYASPIHKGLQPVEVERRKADCMPAHTLTYTVRMCA